MVTRIIGLILVLSLLCGGGCKQKAATAQEQKVSTPREALLQLLRAMKEADASKVVAACRINDEQRPILEAGTEYTRAVYAFRDALIAAYGQEAWERFQDPAHRPGAHDTTFIIITDAELEKAKTLPIEQDEKSATCMMPAGTGHVRMIKTDKGTWVVDGSTFVPASQTPADLRGTLNLLTELVRKYQKAIGKPDLTPSDIDYELGRAIDLLVSKIPDDSPHRFNIDKL